MYNEALEGEGLFKSNLVFPMRTQSGVELSAFFYCSTESIETTSQTVRKGLGAVKINTSPITVNRKYSWQQSTPASISSHPELPWTTRSTTQKTVCIWLHPTESSWCDTSQWEPVCSVDSSCKCHVSFRARPSHHENNPHDIWISKLVQRRFKRRHCIGSIVCFPTYSMWDFQVLKSAL